MMYKIILAHTRSIFNQFQNRKISYSLNSFFISRCAHFTGSVNSVSSIKQFGRTFQLNYVSKCIIHFINMYI